MKVLHITNNYPTKRFPIFGIFVKEQIESLDKIGIENEVLFLNGREKGKLEYLKSIFVIRKKLSKEKFDIIHCHHALSALCLILSLKVAENKVVVSFQNDPLNEFGTLLFYLIKRNTHGWIFKNNSKFISDTNAFYLPNGVNTQLFKPITKHEARKHLNLDQNMIYVLFVSSNKIRKQKRYDRFKDTLKILKDKYGYEHIQEIKLINTERENIPLYINAVDVHLLTSDFEGSPNSVKECMACNIPVVSTNVGNVEELLKKTQGSYVSKSNSPEELALMVHNALTNKFNNGSEQIKFLELDMESVARKIKVIYNKISDKL